MKRYAFVTGATSGIGNALAKELASRGYNLGVLGRRSQLLDKLDSELQEFHVEVFKYPVDVTDQSAVLDAINHFINQTSRIDMVVANAGIANYVWTGEAEMDKWTRLIDVNVNGVINSILPFVPLMKKQGFGHIVGVSSLASVRPLPFGPYSASKVAVKYLMDGLRMDLGKYGIRATTVCPGFVDTELLPKNQYFPFLISSDEAAKKILSAVEANKKTFVFPWPWKLVAMFIRHLPDRVVKFVLRDFPKLVAENEASKFGSR